jgi:1-acyl-sn-glycerol-3-phosphate acyltransferase
MDQKSKNHLFRYSHLWHLLAQYIFFLHRLFYKSIVVVGKENIPQGSPVIFAPNHQNALMDPLAVLMASGKQTIFLARADIFRRPILRKIFTWLKILPVYRIRDGKDSLQHNEQSFDMAIEVLEHGGSIGIFPEAAHANKRSLLPLKKGVPRVAFLAEEKNSFSLGLKIVPVGIYYSRYDTMGGILHVRFGEPIEVNRFEQSFRENAQKAHLLLRDAIADGIRPLAIDISKKDWYEIYESLLSLHARKLAKKLDSRKPMREREFEAQKAIIAALDEQLEINREAVEDIRGKVETYEQLKKKHGLSDKTLFWRWPVIPGLILGSILIIAGMPLFLYGFINHIPAYFIPRKIIKKFRDKQFHSSVKFLWGALVVPLLYLVQSAMIWIVFNHLWIAAAYMLTLPLAGMYAHWFAEQAVFMKNRWRLFFLKRTAPAEMKEMKNLLSSIMHDTSALIRI